MDPLADQEEILAVIHAKRASELLGAGGQRVADLLSTLSDGHPPRAGALVGEPAS